MSIFNRAYFCFYHKIEYLWSFLLLLCCLCSESALAAHILEIQFLEKKSINESQLLEFPPSKQQIASVFEAYQLLKKIPVQLHEKGYLAASVDTFFSTDSVTYAKIYVGNQYQWAMLSLDSLPAALFTAIDIEKANWQNQILKPKKIADLSNKILDYYENIGYPFASLHWSNVQETHQGIVAVLKLEQGQLVHYDSIIFKGDVAISESFLTNYLHVKQGEIYSERQLHGISHKLDELPFLQTGQSPSMQFSPMGNKLIISLKAKKANQINGLIGIQPNPAVLGSILFTADVFLNLKNALKYGETISLTYQNMQYQSPKLQFGILAPYILGTPVAMEGNFELFKRDSSFVRISLDAGIRYQLNASDYLKLSYLSMSNRIGLPDTAYMIQYKSLPENIDAKSRGFSVSFAINRTNYALNPSKGWTGILSGSVLDRKIVKNNDIIEYSNSNINYEGLYEEANQEKQQYRISAHVSQYISLYKKMVGKIAYNGSYISGKQLFQNELFQIGGFKLMRGFDEQSIFSNHYHIVTAEIRLLLDRHSFLYVFSDNAFVHAQFRQHNRINYPISLGLGLSLENKSGIFNIAVAVGKNSGEVFQFRQTRVHFGYAALF